MKKLLLLGALLLLTGCINKPYVDTTSSNFATLQLIPNSKTLIFKDRYYALFYDYKNYMAEKCKGSKKSSLGILETNSDTPSKIVKIKAGTPILISANYQVRSGNSTSTEYTQIVLNPQKNKNYVIQYSKKSINLFRSVSDFNVYTRNGNKISKIPDSKIRNLGKKECRR